MFFSQTAVIIMAVVGLLCWFGGDYTKIPKLSDVGKWVFIVTFARLVWMAT